MDERRVTRVEKYMRATPDYPDGSYLLEVGGVVQMATGYYATLHPDKPSLYWHRLPPVCIIDTSEWPWDRYGTKELATRPRPDMAEANPASQSEQCVADPDCHHDDDENADELGDSGINRKLSQRP